jgi:hypothetical protein
VTRRLLDEGRTSLPAQPAKQLGGQLAALSKDWQGPGGAGLPTEQQESIGEMMLTPDGRVITQFEFRQRLLELPGWEQYTALLTFFITFGPKVDYEVLATVTALCPLIASLDQITTVDEPRPGWEMDAGKADRVRVLVAVFDDVVIGAWEVTGATHEAEIPEGKTRMVSRSTFDTAYDARLDYLVGGPSPRARQRNPQATFELRDLPGADSLIGPAEPTSSGLVQIGRFTLTVSDGGHAELHMPTGATLTVRTGPTVAS